MSIADYQPTNLRFGFCPVASIALETPANATSIEISSLSNPSIGALATGVAAMINDEFVKVVAVAGNVITIGRGCCDTIPAVHPAGSLIWFVENVVASDLVPHPGTSTVAVKPMPRTSSATLPIEYSPPFQVTFNRRHERPYPPAKVRVNGASFSLAVVLDGDTPAMNIEWVHRNRITQADSLVDHEAATVAAEAGATVRVRIFKEDNTLVETVSGLTGTTFSRTLLELAALFASYADEAGYVLIDSQRDGLDSWQIYRIDFSYTGLGPPAIADRSLAYTIGTTSVTQDRSIAYDIESAPASLYRVAVGDFDQAGSTISVASISTSVFDPLVAAGDRPTTVRFAGGFFNQGSVTVSGGFRVRTGTISSPLNADDIDDPSNSGNFYSVPYNDGFSPVGRMVGADALQGPVVIEMGADVNGVFVGVPNTNVGDRRIHVLDSTGAVLGTFVSTSGDGYEEFYIADSNPTARIRGVIVETLDGSSGRNGIAEVALSSTVYVP